MAGPRISVTLARSGVIDEWHLDLASSFEHLEFDLSPRPRQAFLSPRPFLVMRGSNRSGRSATRCKAIARSDRSWSAARWAEPRRAWKAIRGRNASSTRSVALKLIVRGGAP